MTLCRVKARGLRVGVVGLVVLLAIGVAPAALAEPVPVDEVAGAGTDGVGDGAELPLTAEGAAEPPVPPVVDTAVEPPVGSPQRAALDEMRAARDAEQERVEAASEPSEVRPGPADGTAEFLPPEPAPTPVPDGSAPTPVPTDTVAPTVTPGPSEVPGASPGPGASEVPGVPSVDAPGSEPGVPPATGESGPVPEPTPGPTPLPDDTEPTPSAAGAAIVRQVSFSAGGGERGAHRDASAPVARLAQPIDACQPRAGEPWSATYGDGGIVVTPQANAAGSVKVILTNYGMNAWPDGGRTVLSYRLYDDVGNPVAVQAPQTVVPATAPNTWREITAAVGPLTPGAWRLSWDVWVEGVGWFTDPPRSVCGGTIRYTIPNQPPNLTVGQPHHRSTVFTRTPNLFATGSDVDRWPQPQLSYQFVLCRDAAMTVGCVRPEYRGFGSFPVPPGFVDWNQTFWWTARVSDGDKVTDAMEQGVAPHEVTVAVPSTQPWRTVGAGLGVATVQGMLLPHEIWVHQEQDAVLPGMGLPLQIQRTYSSAAAGTRGAFGLGWLSMFDAEVQRPPGNDLLTVTYPDARQEVFGRRADGALVSRADSGVTNRVEELGDGSVRVRTAGQEVLTYRPDGRLDSVARTGQGELRLVRDGGGQVTQLVQQPSGRKLRLSWTTPSCLKAPVISQVATDAPAAGAAPLVWTYGYRCDGQLERVCDPTGACTTYGTATEERFSLSAAGRERYRPRFESTWRYNSLGWDYRYAYHRTDDGRSLTFGYFKPRPDRMADYQEYMNSFGGMTVEVQLGERSTLVPNGPRMEPEVDTYLFDQGRRLRTLAHRRESERPSSNERNWFYHAVTGRLQAFHDENLNTFSMLYNGDNWSGRYTFRDAYTQVTLLNTFNDVDPGAAVNDRVVKREAYPNQGRWPATFGYNPGGELVTRTSGALPDAPLGVRTDYRYTPPSSGGPPAGLLSEVILGNARTRYEYNPGGDLSASVDPAGLRTVNVDDALGRRVAEVAYSDVFPQGVRTEFRLDGMSRVTEVIHPRSRNRVTGVESQRRVCHFYDPDGLLIRTVETAEVCPAPRQDRPGDRSTWFEYDLTAAARPTAVVDPGTGITRYTHAHNFPLVEGGQRFRRSVEIADDRGLYTTMVYGDDDRLVGVEEKRVNGSGRRWAARYTYDHAGRMLAEQDVLGRVTHYEYTDDDLQRRAYRVGVVQPDGSRRDVELWRREFDGEGRVTAEVRGGSRRVEMRYDADGKLIEEVTDPAGLALRRSLGYTVEGHVNRETISAVNNRSFETRYVRDGAGRALQTVRENGDADLVAHFTYDQRGLRRTAVDPRASGPADAAFTSRSTYDELGRLVVETAPPVLIEALNVLGVPAAAGNGTPTTTYPRSAVEGGSWDMPESCAQVSGLRQAHRTGNA